VSLSVILDRLPDIDRNTKQTLQLTSEVFEQTEEFETAAICLDIHEEIDITLDIGLTTCNRSEDAHVRRPMASGNPQDLFSPFSEIDQRKSAICPDHVQLLQLITVAHPTSSPSEAYPTSLGRYCNASARCGGAISASPARSAMVRASFSTRW